MSDIKWKDENWKALKLCIESNNCILMLGPDVATKKVGKKSVPLTEILAKKLAKKFEAEVKKKINTSDLAQVSQYYYHLKRDRDILASEVVSFYKDGKDQNDKLHRNLADLPIHLYITTTPDKMLENALRKKKESGEREGLVVERYHFDGDNKEIVEMGTSKKPLLFYLYGTIEEPDSLMLTEDDLLDFLVNLISKKHHLPKNIRSALNDPNKTLLFLGFGFKHWYLRILFHHLRGRYSKKPSIAMEQCRSKSINDLERTVIFFQNSDYKIRIFKMELNCFVEQLKEECKDIETNVTGVRAENAPEVFISHASEDKDTAAWLSERLEESGIRPWLDKEDLRERGGEDWNKHIKDTISETDYFVVLQSIALKKKKIGYVNKEINEALDRMKEFRKGEGLKFIIPVKIEECPPLEDLKEYQTIDLIDRSNVNEVISTIKRDFEIRRR